VKTLWFPPVPEGRPIPTAEDWAVIDKAIPKLVRQVWKRGRFSPATKLAVAVFLGGIDKANGLEAIIEFQLIKEGLI
jgi:hypothetical protein